MGDLEEYSGCCVVFDDMLDSNQRLIDPFLLLFILLFMSELF